MKSAWPWLIAAGLVLSPSLSASAAETADRVVVHKERRILQLFQGTRLLREYPVALGGDPAGHKEREGDRKTPEGRYVLDWRNDESSFYKSIHVSYPGPQDIEVAAAKGIDPGGMIMIHGQPNYFGWLAFLTQMFDWTDGCIAVTNAEMDEIWDMVPDNTAIEINP
ncbi:L,D-transpeptidase family protein [Sinorhizobium numidicum]|uniref:L,D-transpeptidase family protein n=1 Tax=Sinorhizobium numidicum TaxID=680248 RepID=A0ABY8D439_9HYPH|nr:L,D-transpeptidase family protein [Sinorhizobium numidicum]WEX78253.1 L,D-transpeptidase family protein [Sinorhizobium numidicum]WEX84912.1 L,D-transpeptidase family protein [Sinorhizobium numidicum]